MTVLDRGIFFRFFFILSSHVRNTRCTCTRTCTYMYLFNLLFSVVLLAAGDENDEYGDEDDAEDEADGADDVGPLDQTLGGVDA